MPSDPRTTVPDEHGTLAPARTELAFTPGGLAALPFAGVAVLAGWLIGGTAALFAATALALFALSPLLAWLAVRGLRVGAPAPRAVFAGEGFVVQLAVRNAARRGRARDLLFHCGDERKRDARPAGMLAELAPRAAATALVAHRLGERGRHRVLVVRASTSHPFGLVSCALVFELPADLLAMPRLGSLGDLGRLHAPTPDRPAALLRELRGEEELYGVREWRDGESLRRVHWKLSARRGRTIVRELRSPVDPPLLLVLAAELDAPASSTHRRRAFETAVELAATLAEHHLRRGRRVVLALARASGAEVFELAGRRGLWRALAILAEARAVEGDALAAVRAGLSLERASALPTVAVYAGRRAPAPPPARAARRPVLLDVDDPRTRLVYRRGRALGYRAAVPGELLVV